MDGGVPRLFATCVAPATDRRRSGPGSSRWRGAGSTGRSGLPPASRIQAITPSFISRSISVRSRPSRPPNTKTGVRHQNRCPKPVSDTDLRAENQCQTPNFKGSDSPLKLAPTASGGVRSSPGTKPLFQQPGRRPPCPDVHVSVRPEFRSTLSSAVTTAETASDVSRISPPTPRYCARPRSAGMLQFMPGCS